MRHKRPDWCPKSLETSSDVHPQERQASSEQPDEGQTLSPNPAHVENSSQKSSQTVGTQSCQGRGHIPKVDIFTVSSVTKFQYWSFLI